MTRRIVVTGASGNVGTAFLRVLASSHPDWQVTGIVRRSPDTTVAPYEGHRWVELDIGDPGAAARLSSAAQGADALVHLAWALQPSRRPAVMAKTNIDGSRHVIEAVRAAGVPQLVHVSSLGAYSPMTSVQPKPKMREDWPTGGIRTSLYSRQKAAVERMLDELEADLPGAADLVVTRVRPGLVLQDVAASALARYFLGALAPLAAFAPRLPVLPLPMFLGSGVHADDLGDALCRIVDQRAGGAFNIAAEPPLDSSAVARALGARRIPVPFGLSRALTSATWRVGLQPTDAGWLDIGRFAPLLDTTRARTVLGWAPRYSAEEALAQVVSGLADGAGTASPVLAPRA